MNVCQPVKDYLRLESIAWNKQMPFHALLFMLGLQSTPQSPVEGFFPLPQSLTQPHGVPLHRPVRKGVHLMTGKEELPLSPLFSYF